MSKEEKLMILQMVSEGKITPEQGAELLRAVGDGRQESPAPEETSASVERSVAEATRRAEEIARKAGSEAEAWAAKVAKRAEEFAQRASSEGENLGKVLGESGANLGKILGEGGENLGKVISRIFGRGFSGGPRFDFHEEIKGELSPEGEIKVDLSTTNGRITVDTWDAPTFRLDVRKTANADSEEEAKELTKDGFEFKQDGLNLTARTKEASGAGWFRNYSVGFTLTLPRDRKVNLRLTSTNGRIAVGGISGTRLYAFTCNGRVEAEGCDFKSTEVSSSNGRIEFEGRPGDLVASTANGRVEAKISGLGEWKLTSANGRIVAEIRREPGAAYSVEASTLMGKIDVQGLENAEVLVDDSRQKSGSRRYQARTRGFSDAPAKAKLQASTTNGKVMVTF